MSCTGVLQAKENTVRIRGKKTIAYGEQASVHRRERISGVFDRSHNAWAGIRASDEHFLDSRGTDSRA